MELPFIALASPSLGHEVCLSSKRKQKLFKKEDYREGCYSGCQDFFHWDSGPRGPGTPSRPPKSCPCQEVPVTNHVPQGEGTLSASLEVMLRSPGLEKATSAAPKHSSPAGTATSPTQLCSTVRCSTQRDISLSMALLLDVHSCCP